MRVRLIPNRGTWRAIVRLIAYCFLLGLCATSSLADVAVLRPGDGEATPAAVAAGRTTADRIERFLTFGGVQAQTWTEADLSKQPLDRASVLVIPAGPISPSAAAAAGRYVAAGGRIILFARVEAPTLLQLLGVEVGEPDPGGFDAIQFDDAANTAAPGIPTTVPQTAPAPRRLTLREGVQELGVWSRGERRGPTAVALAPQGAYINAAFTLGEPDAKGWLLAALAGALDSATASRSLRSFRHLAGDALALTSTRWATARVRPGLDATTVETIDRDLTRLRQRIAAAPATASTATERGRALRQLEAGIAEAHRLAYRMVPSPAVEFRGVWIHTYAPTDWDAVAAKLQRSGFNAIIARVGRGGNVIYPSALLPRDAWAERAGGDELKRAVEAAHRHGLAFYAWRVNFHMGSAPRDYYEKLAAEDRLVRDPQGKQQHWANPGDPRNTELEYQAMVELARNYAVDGIQFDYIRYPDEPGFDYDYGPVSRREFEKTSGKPVLSWPRDVLSGARKIEYEAWERGNINRLVERVAGEVRRIRPGLRISAAVWRNHRYWRPILKQDWPLWVEKGWLDFIVPMDYTTEQETLAQTVEVQVANTRGRGAVMAGIGNYLLFTADEVVQQVESARAAGAAGFVLFAYNAEQNEEHLRALAEGATSLPAIPSDRGPTWRLRVPGSLARRDAPLAVASGSSQALRLERSADESSGVRDAAVVIETPAGRRLFTLARLGENPKGKGPWSFTAPAGLWRPALRGTRRGKAGETFPFMVLGPLVEGVSAEELATMRQRESAPITPSGDRPVAIYAFAIGSDRLKEALEGDASVTPYLIYGLTPAHLKGAAVVVLPQLQDVLDLTPETVQALRDWVEAGGTLLLTHEAVGLRWHPRLFPEIGEGAGARSVRSIESVVDLPGLPGSSHIEQAFNDHIALKIAPTTEVLAREPAPSLAPVIARGHFGRGTVLLMGTLPGGGGFPMTAGERVLLRALVVRP
jgi:uncharacterized lipoprotein YddW (UPF0748 family)